MDTKRIPAGVEPKGGLATGEEASGHPTESRRRRQEARYRVFFRDVAEGIYETDLEGNFVFFNEALCRIFGTDPSRLRGRNFREFMEEEHAREAFERFNRVFRTGRRMTDIIWPITRADGRKRIVELSADLIEDEEGRRIGFRGIARDITEKYLARQALRESQRRYEEQYRASRRAEKRYRSLLEFLPDPVAVFNMDNTVSYVNPAFERVFGWTLGEVEGRRLPFVPESLIEETRRGLRELYRIRVIHGYETKRLTKSGRLLDVVLNAALFYEEGDTPSGQVVVLRDITREKRVDRSNQALLRVSMALHEHRSLEEVLEVIIKEVQELISVEGASVILLDEAKKEFYFPVASYDDRATVKKMKEIRFPMDKGVAGEVIRTGKPLIVPDTSKSPYFYHRVDEQSGYRTRNMLDVPIATKDRTIGVLCAVNKKDGDFDATDVEMLSAIASSVALPIENARVNEELERSYREVQSLNRVKDRILHHLSHELKTPVSVLAGSLRILDKRLEAVGDPTVQRTLERVRRNLSRILDIQYGIEDILWDRNYRVYGMLSTLLDACADELEVLVAEEFGDGEAVDRIRRRIEELFGPRDVAVEELRVDAFVRECLDRIRPRFSHRRVEVILEVEETDPIWMPPEVLEKVVEGLVRNAVENTPDGGRVEVSVRRGKKGPVLEIRDFGVGITPEDQQRLFDSIFTTRETSSYSSKRPYDFAAGGKGFDLLRMKIFSERYHFQIRLVSERCPVLVDTAEPCPGEVERCTHCESPADCLRAGGTRVLVEFSG